MRVLAVAEWSWMLLADGDALFLDVNCNHSFIGYSWLIELNNAERRAFEAQGRPYLYRLARDVHDGVPILKGSNSPFKDRNRTDDRGAEVTEAVRTWRAAEQRG